MAAAEAASIRSGLANTTYLGVERYFIWQAVKKIRFAALPLE